MKTDSQKVQNLPSNVTASKDPALKHGEASVGKKIGETHTEAVWKECLYWMRLR